MRINFTKPFLFVSDIDGTLVDYNSQILPENRLMLQEILKNKNCIFAIATGRPYAEMKDIIIQLSLETPYYVIASNGSHIFKVLPNRETEDMEIKPLKNPYYLYEIVKNVFMNQIFVWGIRTKVVLSNATPQQNIRMLELMKDKEKIIRFSGILEKDFEASPYFEKLKNLKKTKKIRYYIYSSKKTSFIEITSFLSSKTTGVKKVLNVCNIEPHQVFLVGDGPNDWEMLTKFQNTFCMANHKIQKPLPKHVNILNSTNEEAFLKEILLLLNYWGA